MATATAVKKAPFRGVSKKDQARFHRWVSKELPHEDFDSISKEQFKALTPDIDAIIKKWCDLSGEKQIPIQVLASIAYVRRFPESWQAELVDKAVRSEFYKKTLFMSQAVINKLSWAESVIALLLSLQEV